MASAFLEKLRSADMISFFHTGRLVADTHLSGDTHLLVDTHHLRDPNEVKRVQANNNLPEIQTS